MDCDICHRKHDAKRLPFLCTVDARNSLFEDRLKNVQLLIENEDLQKEIGTLLSEPSTTPTKGRKDSMQAQQRMAEDRTTQILAAADKFRDDIRAARAEIEARKAALSSRRSDFAAASDGLSDRRAKQQKEVEKSISMTNYRWSRSAEDMARTRSFLCMEAATLYGLDRVEKGSPGQYEYQLGGIPIIELIGMSSSSPEMTSTSLGHICHILMLTSHYLAIRLPAAITLPHRDYPRPTIFNLAGSYRKGDPVFPSQTGAATPNSTSGDAGSQYASRPRPLFIDKPLSQLIKEDPATYSYFIEGVTLLAYNIAWACSTQGVPVGDKGSFEDICNMGRNLYNLLINQQSAGTDGKPTHLGQFSHGTAYNFLSAAEGTEAAKNFKLPNPMKLADKLKKKLLSEAPTPDWEVLDDDAWKVEETPVGKMPEDKSSPRRGSSGWMKVKNR
ncbi:autophagy protein 14 [Fusarium piperis]|uniref:Autophagy-related protein 14 n=1 Tax=Fusarium piperis TaxID=1435070 RepID=A0A9W8WJT2_9HYPO|nr:autophagy protein 14 [Fusarium piperis]